MVLIVFDTQEHLLSPDGAGALCPPPNPAPRNLHWLFLSSGLPENQQSSVGQCSPSICGAGRNPEFLPATLGVVCVGTLAWNRGCCLMQPWNLGTLSAAILEAFVFRMPPSSLEP